MKFPDPLMLSSRAVRDTVIFAGSQLPGTQKPQKDYFINFSDECFVVADGVSDIHGEAAAKLAADTAIWGYKHVRQRPFYWADKRRLLKRIFRSSNLTLWQKRKEQGFENGIATTLSVVIVSINKIWVGNVGNTGVFLYRESLIDELTPSDIDEKGRLTNMLGVKRLGLVPHLAVESFLPGDIVVMATSGVADFVGEDHLRATLETAGDTPESMSNAVINLFRCAEENGSEDNMTVCMIKRIHTEE